MALSIFRKRDPEFNSPEFTLPPPEFAPAHIMSGLFTWELGPYIENQARILQVTCVTCKSTFIQSWPISKAKLTRHVTACHYNLYYRLEQAKDAQAANFKREFAQLSSLANANSRRQNPVLEKPESPNLSLVSQENHHKRARLSEQAHDLSPLEHTLLKVVISQSLPFSFIESPAFKSLISIVGNGNTPSISGADLRLKLEALYSQKRDNVKQLLANVKGKIALSLSYCELNTRSHYMAVTAHFHDDEFCQKSAFIGFENIVTNFSETDNGQLECLDRILAEYSLKNRIISITRDDVNSPNLTSFLAAPSINYLDNSSMKDMVCVENAFGEAADTFLAHNLFKPSSSHEKKSLMEKIDAEYPFFRTLPRSVKNLFDKIKSLDHDLTHNQFMKKSLGKYIGSDWSPKRCVGRQYAEWLVTYNMINRIIQFRPEITSLLNKVNILSQAERIEHSLRRYKIKYEEWTHLSQMNTTLGFFSDPSFSSDHNTGSGVSYILPHAHKIMSLLKGYFSTPFEEEDTLIGIGALEAYDTLDKTYNLWSYGSIFDNLKDLSVATILDPRLRLHAITELRIDEAIVIRILKYFLEVYEKYRREYEQTKGTIPNRAQKREPERSSKSFSKRIPFGEAICDTLAAARVSGEVENYLKSDQSSSSETPSVFYRHRMKLYPIIYRMARDYLATPATSVWAEECLK